jgi:hypothetical protein
MSDGHFRSDVDGISHLHIDINQNRDSSEVNYRFDDIINMLRVQRHELTNIKRKIDDIFNLLNLNPQFVGLTDKLKSSTDELQNVVNANQPETPAV